MFAQNLAAKMVPVSTVCEKCAPYIQNTCNYCNRWLGNVLRMVGEMKFDIKIFNFLAFEHKCMW